MKLMGNKFQINKKELISSQRTGQPVGASATQGHRDKC